MGAVIAAILDVGCFPAVAGLFLTLRSLRSERGEFLIISRGCGTRGLLTQRTQRGGFLIFDYWRVRKWECDNVGMLESGFRVNVAMRPAFAGHASAWTWRKEAVKGGWFRRRIKRV